MELFGTKLRHFQVPVCNIFRETVVNGQVCYEVDVNHVKKNAIDWKSALHEGLSLIVDTNDEYDLKNLINIKKREMDPMDSSIKHFSAFRHYENENSFSIRLKTISKWRTQ